MQISPHSRLVVIHGYRITARIRPAELVRANVQCRTNAQISASAASDCRRGTAVMVKTVNDECIRPTGKCHTGRQSDIVRGVTITGYGEHPLRKQCLRPILLRCLVLSPQRA